MPLHTNMNVSMHAYKCNSAHVMIDIKTEEKSFTVTTTLLLHKKASHSQLYSFLVFHK